MAHDKDPFERKGFWYGSVDYSGRASLLIWLGTAVILQAMTALWIIHHYGILLGWTQ